MNKMRIFRSNEFGEVRTIEINDRTYFCGTDAAKALGYAIPSKAVNTHCKGVSKMEAPTTGGIQTLLFIPEGDLYRLIVHSKLPSAEKFEHWIFDEVLPSIRRNGAYISGQEAMGEQELLARAYEVSQRILAEREKRIGQLETDNARLAVTFNTMAPKAEYFDELVDRNLLSSFTDTAKELGVKRKDFIGFLLEQGYIYRDKKGNLMPRANEKAKGLFEVKQCSNQKTAWAGCQTLLTPKGVETFRLLCQGI